MANHIRDFAKLFTNFTPHQQREFERILDELQNSKEITSLEGSLALLRRKPDQALPIPQVVSRPTVRGAVLEWEPLPDQRVNFYEVQIADEPNFANFITVPTFGVLSVVDGLDATKYARVRGVRRDGTTTPYSSIIEINPRLFDVTGHTGEVFYYKIEGTDTQRLISLTYTPINPDGNSLVYGFISTYGDPAIGIYGTDQITADVNVTILDTDGSFLSASTQWKLTIGEHYSSQAIGPFTVPHPTLNQSLLVTLDVTDATTLLDGTTRLGDRTEVFWGHLNAIELGLN